MKKLVITLTVALMMLFSLNSCETYTYATTQDDIYVETVNDVVHSTVDFNIVIRYGTPYYYNGSLLYYLYEDLYYYPFYYDNYWYVRAYRRPFNHLYYHPYFRPHKYDYRFNRGYRPQHHWYRPNPGRHPNTMRPNPQPHRNDGYHRPNESRPDVHSNRPYTPNRGTTTRPTTPSRPNNRGNITSPNRGTSRGNFGGSRSGGRR